MTQSITALQTEDAIERIQLAHSRNLCTAVVGAGASILAGGPSWTEYLRSLNNGLPPDLQVSLEASRQDPATIYSLLNNRRTNVGLRPIPIKDGFATGPIHDALASWRSNLYLTTNFDERLETAIKTETTFAPTVVFNDELERVNLSKLAEAPIVVKLCSSTRSRNPGFLSDDDFLRLLHDMRGAVQLLVSALLTKTVVFVGCSMTDPLIKHALNEAFLTKLSHGPHVAFLPRDVDPALAWWLRRRLVDVVEFDITPSATEAVNLADSLRACSKEQRIGKESLLVFEPGRVSKAQQILDASSRINRQLGSRGIKRIGFITSSDEIHRAIDQLPTQVEVVPIKAESTGADDESLVSVTRAVLSNSEARWTGFFAPFEFAIQGAAAFCELSGSDELRFHSPQASALLRDKRRFRSFLTERFGNDEHETIRAPNWNKVTFDPEKSLSELLSEIEVAIPNTTHVVIKPIDCAGSVGVRALNLKDKRQCRKAIEELRTVLLRLSEQQETADCSADEFLVEERLSGEEFSLECRKAGARIDTMAVHWKVDVDSYHEHSFFERLFVTIDESNSAIGQVERANEFLLMSIEGLVDGVFHCEYRVQFDNGGNVVAIFPLEIGLRPGGGMVNDSVKYSHFEQSDVYEEGIRLAVGAQLGTLSTKRRVVGTGLVFATEPGVLGLLGIKRFDQLFTTAGRKSQKRKPSYVIGQHDEDARLEFLNWILSNAPRDQVKSDYLRPILQRNRRLDGPFRQKVLDAFPSNGTGLSVTLQKLEPWLKPTDLVVNEEYGYVAGTLATVDEGLEGDSALAEAIAAIELCLSAIECTTHPPMKLRWEPSRLLLPPWWNKYDRGKFRSDPDSWTFSVALREALQLSYRAVAKRQQSNILDLGCGSATPALGIVSEGAGYLGVDIDEDQVAVATQNLDSLGVPHKVLVADVLTDDWLTELSGDPRLNIVAANLPYLPDPRDVLEKEVHGGADGLKYVPFRVLDIADRLTAKYVVLNFSSLCDVERIAHQLTVRDYFAVGVVATAAPIEHYGARILDDVRDFARFVDDAGELQVIYSLILAPREGLPANLACRWAEEQIRLLGAHVEQSIIGRYHG